MYTIIELEIIPAKDKYGLFYNRNDCTNFYPYFNDDINITKINYILKEDKVTKIKLVIDYPITSFKKLFFNCRYIESINFKKFYRTNIADMSHMFFKCKSLKEMTFENFNTDNVTNMKNMFYKCIELKKLNLSNFNTRLVTDMKYMFYKCFSLKELNVTNFDKIM